MPILVTLDEILARRGMTLTQLSDAVDITLANLSILKTGKAKAMRFSTLEAICEVLECQPADILAYRRD
jgi:putative transcriptional regulator